LCSGLVTLAEKRSSREETYVVTSAHDVRRLTLVYNRGLSVPGAEAHVPNLKMYRSEAGFNAIMSWYEHTLARIEILVDSVYVDTRFGRTHMLAAGS
jgi:hypothetical protein